MDEKRKLLFDKVVQDIIVTLNVITKCVSGTPYLVLWVLWVETRWEYSQNGSDFSLLAAKFAKDGIKNRTASVIGPIFSQTGYLCQGSPNEKLHRVVPMILHYI